MGANLVHTHSIVWVQNYEGFVTQSSLVSNCLLSRHIHIFLFHLSSIIQKSAYVYAPAPVAGTPLAVAGTMS